jgi:hypothetical protein
MRKRLYLIVTSLLFLSVAGFSQSTSPRYGTTANQDNTGRILTYKYVSLTDATGADSVVARPREYETTYRVTLVDSFTFKQPVITSCYAGDYIVIIASAASGTPKLKFTGSNWITAGTATLSTGLRAVIKLVFDGAKWVEAGRVVQ